ncbi:MAG TPA: acetylornithine deacetylase [Gammaproteobacteria bacterium]|nr:acetylornithine deacetylase [Gammaproteobacteria bacterium]
MTVLEWLHTLIAFDTTSHLSNLELIDVIQVWMRRFDADLQLIRDPIEEKANLFVTLPAASGRTDGGLILSGHTDVVPVEGQKWDTNPFEMTQIGDQIFGRGTADMKGFLAVVLALAPKFKDMKLAYPLHFAFSYDEEIGCRGAPFMIAALPDIGWQPRACIVGEPTEMMPLVAHKGKQSFRCTVHGNAAHSSLTPKGCNAIEYAAQLICFIRGMADEFKNNGPYDPAYDVPYTTLTTNLIKGGNASNTIPSQCEFVFEFRNLMENTQAALEGKIQKYIQQDLLPYMLREYSGAKITLDKFAGAPGLSQVEEEDINKLVRKLTNDHEVRKASYATEAGLFQQAEIPSILCGPGSIEQAHRPNEYITVEQLQKCEDFLLKVVKEACRPG